MEYSIGIDATWSLPPLEPVRTSLTLKEQLLCRRRSVIRRYPLMFQGGTLCCVTTHDLRADAAR